MERTVHRILGRESVPHVRAAGLTRDTFTLFADSPAWASIARFRVPDICAALRTELPRIRRARVEVMETEAPVEPPPAGEANPSHLPRPGCCAPPRARSTIRGSRGSSFDSPAANALPPGEVRERAAVIGAQSAVTGRP